MHNYIHVTHVDDEVTCTLHFLNDTCNLFLPQTTPATEFLKDHAQVLEEYHRKTGRQAGPVERSAGD